MQKKSHGCLVLIDKSVPREGSLFSITWQSLGVMPNRDRRQTFLSAPHMHMIDSYIIPIFCWQSLEKKHNFSKDEECFSINL